MKAAFTFCCADLPCAEDDADSSNVVDASFFLGGARATAAAAEADVVDAEDDDAISDFDDDDDDDDDDSDDFDDDDDDFDDDARTAAFGGERETRDSLEGLELPGLIRRKSCGENTRGALRARALTSVDAADMFSRCGRQGCLNCDLITFDGNSMAGACDCRGHPGFLARKSAIEIFQKSRWPAGTCAFAAVSR